MGFIRNRQDKPDIVQRADVFLAPFRYEILLYSSLFQSVYLIFLSFFFCSCQDGRSNTICEIEHNPVITTRFYDIRVMATDPAGNVSEQTCSVAVIPKGHYNKRKKDSKSDSNSKSSRGDSRLLEMLEGTAGDKPSHQMPKKTDSKKMHGKGKGKGDIEYHHDPDDLRREFMKSTQRYVIASTTLVWDSELNTDLDEPPIPECEKEEKKSGKGKGKGDRGKHSDP